MNPVLQLRLATLFVTKWELILIKGETEKVILRIWGGGGLF